MDENADKEEGVALRTASAMHGAPFQGTLLERYQFHGKRSFSSSFRRTFISVTGAESLELAFYEEGLMISLSESASELRQDRTCVDECYSLGCGWCCCICPPSAAFSTASAEYRWHFVQRSALRDVQVSCRVLKIGHRQQCQALITLYLFHDVTSHQEEIPHLFQVALEPAMAARFFSFAQFYMLQRKWNAEEVENQHRVIALQAGSLLLKNKESQKEEKEKTRS